MLTDGLRFAVGRYDRNDSGDVRTLQHLLNRAEQSHRLSVSGRFDEETDRAIRDLQRAFARTPDGRITPDSPDFWLLLARAREGLDELTPIARYMAAEINMNAAGDDARRMRELNGLSASSCIEDWRNLDWLRRLLQPVEDCVTRELSSRAAALLAWAAKVRQGGPWDHKPKISRRFRPRVFGPGGEQHWHVYGTTAYFYDVWSNVHYGYVGRAAGFSDGVLLDGAGLEQVGSSIARGSLPSRDPRVSGLRAWDDPTDRVAIEIGIGLFRTHPKGLTAETLLRAILEARGIRTKPLVP